jgi:2-polyprenyl-3-methyl-5-hydroxy-6-metoxy-1,4-benzoquinol methylase
MNNDYHKFVISDGKFIGKFDQMYADCIDPWNQSTETMRNSTRNRIATLNCEKLRTKYSCTKILEIGCGFGFLSSTLSSLGFTTMGTDISENAILKAREFSPNLEFSVATFDDESVLNQFEPDIILMPELTWYVLDHLDNFLLTLKTYAKKMNRPVFLIHLLATYKLGTQEYGNHKFTNNDQILDYFNLNYLEAGYVRTFAENGNISEGTYFVARL